MLTWSLKGYIDLFWLDELALAQAVGNFYMSGSSKRNSYYTYMYIGPYLLACTVFLQNNCPLTLDLRTDGSVPNPRAGWNTNTALPYFFPTESKK